MQSGSATGNPKNKVALAPGRSLMDWIRLGNSGVDLTGTNGKILDVTRAELSTHNKKDDAWICLRGKVYNITRYLEFHPGGVDELMRGVGIDATSLFDQVHAWVNYESLLNKCYVGNLVLSSDENFFSPPSLVSSIPKKTEEKQPYPSCVEKFEWYQKISGVVFVFHLNKSIRKLHMNKKIEGEFWVFMDDMWIGWKLLSKINWPPTISLVLSKNVLSLEIKLEKIASDPWGRLVTLKAGEKPQPPNRSQLKIKEIKQINHNVFIIGLSFVNPIFNYVPIGYHVTLFTNIKGVDIERQYTPISNLVAEFPHDVTLMVKYYPEGVFSSWLTSLKVNDIVNSYMPVGSFNPLALNDVTHLILLAAGTGFTPMVRLIQWSLHLRKLSNIKLIFFNRTENDIIWKDELDDIAQIDARFSVEHVLSQPDSSWKGRQGFLTLQLLQSAIPDFSKDVPLPYFVCVCGPIAFTQLTERYLQDMNYDAGHYFCFRG